MDKSPQALSLLSMMEECACIVSVFVRGGDRVWWCRSSQGYGICGPSLAGRHHLGTLSLSGWPLYLASPHANSRPTPLSFSSVKTLPGAHLHFLRHSDAGF